MTRSGLRRDSHSGKALRNILETLPRDELFQASEDELFATATGILQLQGRSRSRLFVRRDKYGRFFSCLVFIPRDRFNTDVRDRIENLLKRAFRGERVDSTIHVGESVLARLHLVIRPKPGDQPKYDVAELEDADRATSCATGTTSCATSWCRSMARRRALEAGQPFRQGVAGRLHRGSHAARRGDRRRGCRPGCKRRERHPPVACTARAASGDNLHFKLYRYGSADHAVRGVADAREHGPERSCPSTRTRWTSAMRRSPSRTSTVQTGGALRLRHRPDSRTPSPTQLRAHLARPGRERRLQQADPERQLDWRQVAMLRGLCKYLLQTGVPFSQSYMEETLNRYPLIAGLLVELFEARFDPERETAEQGGHRGRAQAPATELQTLMTEERRQVPSGHRRRRGQAHAANRATCRCRRSSPRCACCSSASPAWTKTASCAPSRR